MNYTKRVSRRPDRQEPQRRPNSVLTEYTFRVIFDEVIHLVFRTIARCGRSAEEQRCIWAMMRIWRRLPETRRVQVRALIDRIALDAPEKRALYDVAVRACLPEAVCARTGVSRRRLGEMRREFYERFEL